MGLAYSQPACQSAYVGDVHGLFALLSEDPSQLNSQDSESGDTPLIAACRRGNLRVVQYLLDNGADVHMSNKKRRTALHYASKRTLSLLDYLMVAVLMPILLIGYFLLPRALLWKQSCEERLDSAERCWIPSQRMVEQALQKQRQTVLLMQTVLSSDVNVNAVDYKGNTALHYVCQRKSHRLVPLLLQKHASIHIQNGAGLLKDGETPLDIASRLKFTNIINMLKKTQ